MRRALAWLFSRRFTVVDLAAFLWWNALLMQGRYWAATAVIAADMVVGIIGATACDILDVERRP